MNGKRYVIIDHFCMKMVIFNHNGNILFNNGES